MVIGSKDLHNMFHELHRAYGQIVMRELSGIGLYRGQPPVLFLLDRSGSGLTQAQLAHSLFVSPASITVSLGRMEKAGLIERRPDPTDARCNHVTITNHGRIVMREAERRIENIESRMFEGFSDADIRLFLELLNRSRANLTQSEGTKC